MVNRIVFPFCAALLFAGCFSYTPVTSVTDVEPGYTVRARVSQTASARIAPLLGTSNERMLDGTLIAK